MITTGEGATATTQALDFFYDANGTPLALKVSDATYYYVTNLQGDVIQLVDSTGAAVAAYEYDPFGNIVSKSGDLAELNPLRYRGYYYDSETGFYYLQSRYYDPKIGRFINADSYASTGQGFTGYNMFAYCRNNPASRIDISGTADEVCYNNNGEIFDNNDLTGLDGGGGMKSTYVSGVTNHSNGGNGTGSMIGDIAYIDAKAAATTYIPTWGWEEIFAFISSLFSGQSSNHSQCFVEGTLVQTAEGTTAIENIEVGDYVWAWDEESGDVALKEVVETYVNQADELIHVFVNGEEIVTTPEHPFYSPVKGWTTAVHLRAGDILVLVNGEYVVVEKIQHEILESPVTVYNFQVDGYHTYYVADSGVLVHNTCGGRGQLRKNMLKNGPAPGGNYQAHHGLPWKNRDYFNQAGLDVNDPRFGRWVLGGGNGGHQSWSRAYGRLWDDYIICHPIPDAIDIIDYFNKLNGL